MNAGERRDNYQIMFERTRALFLKYDQQKMIERFQLDADERYLYLTFVARPYRIERATGAMEYWKDERASAECVATESTADERASAECVATECAADENPRAERVATESAADEAPRAERVATECAVDENPRAERVATECAADKNPRAECVATESAADETPRAERVATESAADETPRAERVATESAVDETPRAERVATESAADETPRAERVATECAADKNPRAERVATECAADERASAECVAIESAADERASAECVATESAAGVWLPAGHGDGMTIYDILCDSKPDARVSGRFQNAWNQRNVSSAPSGSLFQSSADFFSGKCALLSAACERLGGERVSTGDVGFDIPVFNEIKMRMLFWDADDEFPASMNLQWDEHILDFMRYETTFYAAGFILNRLREEAENERGVAKAD